MKLRDIYLMTALFAGMTTASAQTFNVNSSGVTYSYPSSTTGEMNIGQNRSLEISGRSFQLVDGVRMWVDNSVVEDNVVSVVYSSTGASVTVAGNIARYIEASVDGGHVNVTQSPDVSASTCGEITYRLKGNSEAGSFSMTGSFKSTIELNGVSLASDKGAALDIQNGKRINLRVGAGTDNYLSDFKSGDQKGCVVCKGHLEVKGEGNLYVAGNASHALYAKEYIEISNASVTVASAKKDGLNCNQYFAMKSGSLQIDNVGDDGVQVSYKDETDREAEDTGAVTVKGGKININVTAAAAKGIKCEGPMTISGGEFDIKVTGHGVWDSAKNKTKASACLGSDENIDINGGTLRLTATGGGGKGINCDGDLNITDGKIDIHTSGGVVAYVNGSLNTNYTGNTDRISSDMKSSPKGIKADGNVVISGGETNVVTAGNGAEGIESKSTLTITDGTVKVKATDDAINSSSHLYIKGGNVTAISTGNDGLDSNGNLYIEGGYVMVFGSGSPECGLDANEEQGYTVIFTGGTVLAVGGGNSVPSSSSGSKQPYVSGSGSVSANMQIKLTDSAGNALASFTVPAEYNSSSSGSGTRPGPGGSSGGSILITCPGLSSGTQYKLGLGTTTTSVSAQLTGSSGGGGRPR